MIILSLRTDKPEAEIGLFASENQLGYEVWSAHRALAETIHLKIADLLKVQHIALKNLEGIVCYQGPGSFTGLRIGLSVANALAASLSIPIIGVENEDKWLQNGIEKLLQRQNDNAVMPVYG